jgi:alpha(1,3/1,4) fucosyltransferase
LPEVELDKPVKINFVDFWHPDTIECKQNNPIYKLLIKRFNIEISEEPDFLLYSCFGLEHIKYRCCRIFFTGENVRPKFNKCDYAFSFDYPITERNYRLPLYRFYKGYENLSGRKDAKSILAGKTKFCNFIYSNERAKERIIFYNKLQQYKRVDSGGKVLNNIGGCVKDKLPFQSPYKFTIAFENSSYPGYTTEKIMEAMLANTIPIYWGNPRVAEDFNVKSFINCHDYDNFDEVVEKVIEINNNNKLYLEIMSQPWFCNNKELPYLKEESILDKFAEIFSKHDLEPVAQNVKVSLIENLMYYPLRMRKKKHLFR